MMDTMDTINLLPPQRVAARRRAALIRRWSSVVTVYAAVVAGAVVMLRGGSSNDGSQLAAQIRQAQAQLDQTRHAIDALRTQSGSIVRSLRVEQALTDRPDLSVLLAQIGTRVGSEVRLDRIVITPPGATDELVVSLAGLASDQQAVSRFVLAIEESSLFHRVELRSTNRQEMGSIELARFDILCLVGEPTP